MKKTLKIQGMSCDHCRSRVEAALNAIPGVRAEVDLKNNRAVVMSDTEIDDAVLVAAVTEIGFGAAVSHGLFK